MAPRSDFPLMLLGLNDGLKKQERYPDLKKPEDDLFLK